MSNMKSLAKKILAKLGASTIDAAPNPDATEFEVNNWVISDFVLSRLVPIVGVHPYPLNELMLMAGAICRFRPTHVFEWGTNVGASARVFYETATHFKLPIEIHSIDLPGDVEHVEHPGSRRGNLVKGKPGVSLHLGDGLETSLAIYRTLPKSSRVLFFVDGDHSYESVKRELEAIVTHVAEPKVLLHDTFFQSPDAGYNVGPHLAVRDVLERLPAGRRLRTMETKTGLPGMTLVY
jgi:cephalosporin hydroxylase